MIFVSAQTNELRDLEYVTHKTTAIFKTFSQSSKLDANGDNVYVKACAKRL